MCFFIEENHCSSKKESKILPVCKKLENGIKTRVEHHNENGYLHWARTVREGKDCQGGLKYECT
jgi:hypothetical protein